MNIKLLPVRGDMLFLAVLLVIIGLCPLGVLIAAGTGKEFGTSLALTLLFYLFLTLEILLLLQASGTFALGALLFMILAVIFGLIAFIHGIVVIVRHS